MALITATLMICAAMGIASRVRSQPDHQEQGFPPLARIRVSATDVDLLLNTLRELAGSEHLHFTQGSFRRGDRTVTQMTLKRDGGSTLLHGSDFRKAAQYEITAYSHEDEQAWRPLWIRLNERLVAVFGAPNVKNDFDELKTDTPHARSMTEIQHD
jgi:hypothetical protein